MSKSNIIIIYSELDQLQSLHITSVPIEQEMLLCKVEFASLVEEQKGKNLRRRRAFYSRPEAAQETHRPIRRF
jgi:hypothetical protein